MEMTKSDILKLSQLGREVHSKLDKKGMFKEVKKHEKGLEEGRITNGTGYPIIGIEKFLGYYDSSMNIAYNPSISLTTDFSMAEAFCQYLRSGKDEVVLDGISSDKYTKRMEKALGFFKKENRISGSFRFYIARKKRYKDAKGLGESASVASAASEALVKCVYGEEASKDRRLVSMYARLVSGSGTRSSSGGVSMWLSYPGIKSSQCYAERLNEKQNNINFFAIPEKSKIETIGAHDAAKKSDFYKHWVFGKFSRFLDEVEFSGIDQLLEAAERDTFRLDAVLMSGGMFVHNDRSLQRIKKFMDFKETDNRVFMSADTGPSLVFFSRSAKALASLKKFLGEEVLQGSIPRPASSARSLQLPREASAFFES
ncbi:MAG: mevalonate pyrophosphate decarboxylase [Candidatus Marsarchaeota archaeon]|nr:mevalonate pyrophosphate decarboxylase [Candidatus Marsarchaeota archaeon]